MDREEIEIEGLRSELRDRLIEMELRHERDSIQEFERWWHDEGNERSYFELKHRLELKEESLRMIRLIEEM